MIKSLRFSFTLLITIILANQMYAGNKYARIDRHARFAPEKYAKSISTLARYLVKPARNEIEKARALYMWIVHHIKYDMKALSRYIYTRRRIGRALYYARSVLKTRKAVCGGFSRLFKALCDVVGLEAVVIGGWFKDTAAFIGRRINRLTFRDKPNHAWNAVKLNGKWYFVENTYGTCWGNYKDRHTGIKIYNPAIMDYFFMTAPEKMVLTHYPSKKKWLLMKRPITRRTFMENAYLFPGFFLHNLKLVTPIKFNTRCGRHASIVLKNLPGGRKRTYAFQFYKKVLAHDMKMNKYKLVYFKRNGSNTAIARLKFPRPGEYLVLIAVIEVMGRKYKSDHCALYRFISRW